MYDVFISHSSQDTDIVRELADQLRTEGISVFLDIDTLQAGEDWHESISSALENARAVLVLSQDSSAEGLVKEEVAIAQRNAREGSSLLVPVLIGDVDWTSLPRGLEKFHAIRMHDRQGLPSVAKAVAKAVHTTETRADPVDAYFRPRWAKSSSWKREHHDARRASTCRRRGKRMTHVTFVHGIGSKPASDELLTEWQVAGATASPSALANPLCDPS